MKFARHIGDGLRETGNTNSLNAAALRTRRPLETRQTHIVGLIRFYGAVIILIGFFANQSGASPWPRARGDFFFSSGTDYFQSRGDFVFDAPPFENGTEDRFTRISSNNYIEYGLSDHWQASFKLTYASAIISSEFTRLQTDGLAEIEGSLQRQVWRGERDVLSVALIAGRQSSLGAGINPALLSDGIDGEIRALYGRTVLQKPIKIFATTELGYRRRFGAPADQVRTDVKLGMEPHQRILLLVDIFNTISLRNNEQNGADFDVVKLQPSIALRVYRHWRVQAGANFEIAGRNIALGNSLFLNLWSEF